MMTLQEPLTITENILDQLVARALADTEQARAEHPKRRPTWAPPIPFEQELVEALEEAKSKFQWTFESGYGRLWAAWDSPRYFKEIRFGGFNLYAGKERGGWFSIIKIRRGRGDTWVAVESWSPTSPRPWTKREVELVKEHARRKAQIQKRYAEFGEVRPEWKFERDLQEDLVRAREVFEKESALHAEYLERSQLYNRLRDLGLVALARFAGAPDEVMRTGAHLAGICCICGRTLTDPTSMRLGIGPECRGER
jgi:hypothetical protein